MFPQLQFVIFLSSEYFFCWAAVPHFLINDMAWVLNQTLSLLSLSLLSHLSLCYTHIHIVFTAHKSQKQIHIGMTDGVEGQRDAVFVTRVTD